MKVLISAYACEPGEGSEPGAGWAWAREAARRHEVWVMTRANNAERIDAALREEPELDFRPVYLDLPRWMQLWKKRVPWGVNLYYLCWQLLAHRTAKALHQRERFDLAHHLTFAVDWMPAAVAFVPGLPAVWGPVGGATKTPWSMWRWFGVRGLMEEAIRSATTGAFRVVFGRPTARRCALVIAQNDDVARVFEDIAPTVTAPNVAVTVPAGEERITHGHSGREKRALFVGRLIPWKGIKLAVAAMGEPAASGWSLDVYGDGYARRSVERLAARVAPGRVHFHGNRPRGEVIAALSTADGFLFPSFHDSAPWAVGEALAAGCPVVCLDHGGPPVLLEVAGGPGVALGVDGAMPSLLAAALGSVHRTSPRPDLWVSRMEAAVHRWYEGRDAESSPRVLDVSER